MIRKHWNLTDNVYYQSRTVSVTRPVALKSQLSAETLHKLRKRPFVFLTEQELAECLTPAEQDSYLKAAYRWLWVERHKGPFWLARLSHAYMWWNPQHLDPENTALFWRIVNGQLAGPFGPNEKTHSELTF